MRCSDEKDDLDSYNVRIEHSDSEEDAYAENAEVREELEATSTDQGAFRSLFVIH